MFLMPGLIITLYTTGVINKVLSPQHKMEMLRYLCNHQLQDGGYGLHIEGHSTMFGTALRGAAALKRQAGSSLPRSIRVLTLLGEAAAIRPGLSHKQHPDLMRCCCCC